MTRAVHFHWLAVVVAFGAQAQEPSREVVLAGCVGLDEREISRLISLEVGAVAPDPRSIPPFTVALTCSGGELFINVEDAVTGKSLQRQLPARTGTGAERLIALATAQLLRVSWMELLMATPPPPPEQTHTTPPSAAAIAVAKSVAQEALVPQLKGTSSGNELSIAGGPVWRDLGQPFAVGQLAVRGAHLLSEQLSLCIQLSGEAGSAKRQSGAVNAWGTFAGAGGSWSSPRLALLSLDVTVLVGAGYLALSGSAAGSGITASTLGGFAFDARLAFGPTLRYQGFVIAAETEVAFSAPRTVGEVAGERSVFSGGFSVGVRLRAGWTFGAT